MGALEQTPPPHARTPAFIHLQFRRQSTGALSRSPNRTPSFAFAFDIDGVLLHGSRPIPGASETLRLLQDQNIPFILLTNGGGKHEKDRVADLSAKLEVPLTTANFIQSHTPFQNLVRPGAPLAGNDKTVLVTGSDAEKAREILLAYGFKSVVTPADILMADPKIWPFEPLMEELYSRTAWPLPKPLMPRDYGALPEEEFAKVAGEYLKIDAVLAVNDPRDWALDIQLYMDLQLSRQGYLGTYSPKNGPGGWQTDGQPEMIFSNGDLQWSTNYHLPRLAQGAFQAAIVGVWEKLTGGAELKRRVFGKPQAETYDFAEDVLSRHRGEMLGEEVEPLRTVYMIGDNPESDIAGANTFKSPVGTKWRSILVKTGVWDPKRGLPTHEPMMVVQDVKEAVWSALEREGWSKENK